MKKSNEKSNEVHPLGSGRSGAIEFIHSDGSKHRFYSTINRLTGDRLSAFDNEAPTVNDSIRWVKSVFRDVRAKAAVTSVVGTF
jgi:hypothetical protein